MYVVITLVAVAVLVAIDQLTKWWAVGALANGTVIPVWPEVFELRYTENRGAAFGMLQNHQWLFVIATIALVAIIAALLYSGKLPRHALVTAACVLIIAGGIGNLIDRTVSGYVVDFLYFRLIDFPIFNFADICVTGGAIAGIVYLLFFDGKHPTEEPYGKNDTALVMRADGTAPGQGDSPADGRDAFDCTEMDGAGTDNGQRETAD